MTVGRPGRLVLEDLADRPANLTQVDLEEREVIALRGLCELLPVEPRASMCEWSHRALAYRTSCFRKLMITESWPFVTCGDPAKK